ncbi:S-protein homolog 26-like [Capsella rubella]|uniref:S-protein homolog 26-like n=1 Tax=Capsella rubella TaxID=81985 RepID=UPI000CD4B6AD|nr:S-protein homolog 26-like [Capsella rubella]
MSNTALSSSYTHSTWIRNLLHENNDLIVHCKSKDQDMGYYRVHPTGSYNLLVDAEYGELFWCHLWQGPSFKHHQVFRVRDGNVWEAREDGIYLSGIQSFEHLGQPVFVYGWDVPLNLSRASSFGFFWFGSNNTNLE